MSVGGAGNVYYDTCVARGLAESLRIFQTISDVLVYILGKEFNIIHIRKIMFVDPTKDINKCNLRAFNMIKTKCRVSLVWNKMYVDTSTNLIVYSANLDYILVR